MEASEPEGLTRGGGRRGREFACQMLAALVGERRLLLVEGRAGAACSVLCQSVESRRSQCHVSAKGARAVAWSDNLPGATQSCV